MRSLYEINSALTALINPETGELMDYEAFDGLQMEREAKIEGMALWVKDSVAEATAIKAEVDNLIERKRVIENRVERLKGYLDSALDGEKFSTAKCSVTFRKTSSVSVDDPEALITWAEQNGYYDCVRQKAPEVSKTGVAALIKSGASVPYAHVTEGRSVGVK